MSKIVHKFSAVFVVLNLLFGISAYAESTINIVDDIYSFTVTVQSDEFSERPTITMTNFDSTEVYYVGEGRVEENNGGYTFIFDTFNVPKNLNTGKYLIKVGGKGSVKTQKEFTFINQAEIVDAIAAIDDADKVTLIEALETNGEFLGIDVHDYIGLDYEWKVCVNGAIDAIELTLTENNSNLSEVLTLLRKTFNEKMEEVLICSDKTTQGVCNKLSSVKSLTFDQNEFFDFTNIETVSDYISKYAFDPEGNTKEQLLDAFDEAVLLDNIQKCDWETVAKSLKYYENKGLFTYNFAAFDKLSNANKAKVLADLKTPVPSTAGEIANKINASIKKLNTPTGGGGGSSSGSSSGKKQSITNITNITNIGNKIEENTATKNPEAFSDISSVSWAKDSIETLYEKKIISGDGSGNFYPDNSVTREEFVKMIVTALQLDINEQESKFNDVTLDSWYNPYVNAAVDNKLINGISDSEFGVGLSIIRQDMAVIVYNALNFRGAVLEKKAEKKFVDEADISEYAIEAVCNLTDANIISGMGDGVFAPREKVTRAQAAKIVFEMLKEI